MGGEPGVEPLVGAGDQGEAEQRRGSGCRQHQEDHHGLHEAAAQQAAEGVLQLVCPGVLAVVVAADRGADPAEGRGADGRGDPQHRPGALSGGAELVFRHLVPGRFHRGAVDRGDLQALPLCSISGIAGSRHAAAINMQPDRDQPSETRHQAT
jgi:hypothetical protein